MMKHKVSHLYLSLTVLCILIGILIGSFFYLYTHAVLHKDYAIYYYMAAFLLLIPGIVLGALLKAEIYCFPLEYAVAKETFIDERIQVIINECIKKGVVISISSEEIIKCIYKQDDTLLTCRCLLYDYQTLNSELALLESVA